MLASISKQVKTYSAWHAYLQSELSNILKNDKRKQKVLECIVLMFPK